MSRGNKRTIGTAGESQLINCCDIHLEKGKNFVSIWRANSFPVTVGTGLLYRKTNRKFDHKITNDLPFPPLHL